MGVAGCRKQALKVYPWLRIVAFCFMRNGCVQMGKARIGDDGFGFRARHRCSPMQRKAWQNSPMSPARCPTLHSSIKASKYPSLRLMIKSFQGSSAFSLICKSALHAFPLVLPLSHPQTEKLRCLRTRLPTSNFLSFK